MVRLLVEGDHGAMLVVPASNRAAIALMVNNDAKMGLSLYALKQIAVEIRVILEGEE
jgi:predicted regulator of Ras-like GTPase activity (Roadblock/LC7/MglB family)